MAEPFVSVRHEDGRTGRIPASNVDAARELGWDSGEPVEIRPEGAPQSDAWLTETVPEPAAMPREKTGVGSAAALGATAGGTLGWADDVKAAVDTVRNMSRYYLQRQEVGAVPNIRTEKGLDAGPAGFESFRKSAAAPYEQAQQDRPLVYQGAELAGAMAVPMPGVASAKGALKLAKVGRLAKIGQRFEKPIQLAKAGAGMGAVAGAGYSEGDLGDRVAGAGMGAVAGGALAPAASAVLSTPALRGAAAGGAAYAGYDAADEFAGGYLPNMAKPLVALLAGVTAASPKLIGNILVKGMKFGTEESQKAAIDKVLTLTPQGREMSKKILRDAPEAEGLSKLSNEMLQAQDLSLIHI